MRLAMKSRDPAIRKSLRLQLTSSVNCITISGISSSNVGRVQLLLVFCFLYIKIIES